MSSIEYINSTTLTSGLTEVIFSSIPATYTDLVLTAVLDTNYNLGATISMYLRLNGDTASNYSSTWLLGNGSAASSSRASNDTNGIYIGEASGTANAAQPIFIHICSYANTNLFKTVLSSSSVASAWITNEVGLWRSTSAVSSLTIRCGGYTIESGATFTLWGVK